MAELMFPDVAGSFQQGQQFGMQQRAVNEGEQRRNSLASFAQQAYGADPSQQRGIIGQAVGVDPDSGFALEQSLQKSKGARVRGLSQRAKLFVGMAEAGNEQAAVSMYPQLAQEARQLGLGEVPMEYSPTMLPALKQFAMLGDGGESDSLKSLRVGEDGFYYAIQGGQLVNTGVRAAPNNQVFDTGAGIYGIDKRTLNAAPVNVGGGAPQATASPQAGLYQTPQGITRIDDDLSPEQREAAMADMAGGGVASSVQLSPRDSAPQHFGGQQLRSAPKPAGIPAGYRDDGMGGLTPIPGGPAQVAIDARADAAAARKAAEDVKASQKQQAIDARQAAAAEASNGLIDAIDRLTTSEGFGSLGTAMGDMLINAPLVRNSAKDAHAQLKNISGQVALTTMSTLKALSSQGATGFGSLTAPELSLLQNSIATLQSEDISNAELKSSLKIIRDTMAKTAEWKAPQGATAAPTNDDDALIGKYLD